MTAVAVVIGVVTIVTGAEQLNSICDSCNRGRDRSYRSCSNRLARLLDGKRRRDVVQQQVRHEGVQRIELQEIRRVIHGTAMAWPHNLRLVVAVLGARVDLKLDVAHVEHCCDEIQSLRRLLVAAAEGAPRVGSDAVTTVTNHHDRYNCNHRVQRIESSDAIPAVTTVTAVT